MPDPDSAQIYFGSLITFLTLALAAPIDAVDPETIEMMSYWW
jgi:hypothetical protein